MKKLTDWLLLNVLPVLARHILGGLAWSIRFSAVDMPDFDPDKNAVIAYWHGRLLMMPYARRFYRRKFAVMVSRHKDGEIIARIVNKMGILTPRGSSTRGGMAALKEVIRLSREGVTVAFTPDGPKGPRYVAQMGVIQAAKAAALPIIPVTYSTRKKKLSLPGTGSLSLTRSLRACSCSASL